VPFFKAFFHIALGVSKEPDVLIILKSHSSLNIPVKISLFQINLPPPTLNPIGKTDPFPEPSVPYIFTDRN
jgi:hypothetical protein